VIIPTILAELIILMGAVIIDVIFGEPKEYLHPVALVGKLSSRTEKSFMKLGNKVLAGFVFLVVIILVFTVPLYIVLKIVSSVQFLYFIVAMIAFKTTFSITSMGDHVKPIVRALETNDIETARTKLSLIVRRETKDMDATHICSATIETISEGLVDGFLTPMMFFALFGIIGAFFARIVNTMDSMIGYRNRQYFEFGRWTAIADTLINYIPARVSAAIISFSSELLNYRVQSVPLREVRVLTESTNAGWPMGSIATSLNIKLEKYGHYVLNENGFEPSVGDIKRTMNIYYTSIYLSFLIFILPIMIIVFLLEVVW
jgi:adenosylcobinamide-phosphate synthase